MTPGPSIEVSGACVRMCLVQMRLTDRRTVFVGGCRRGTMKFVCPVLLLATAVGASASLQAAATRAGVHAKPRLACKRAVAEGSGPPPHACMKHARVGVGRILLDLALACDLGRRARTTSAGRGSQPERGTSVANPGPHRLGQPILRYMATVFPCNGSQRPVAACRYAGSLGQSLSRAPLLGASLPRCNEV